LDSPHCTLYVCACLDILLKVCVAPETFLLVSYVILSPHSLSFGSFHGGVFFVPLSVRGEGRSGPSAFPFPFLNRWFLCVPPTSLLQSSFFKSSSALSLIDCDRVLFVSQSEHPFSFCAFSVSVFSFSGGVRVSRRFYPPRGVEFSDFVPDFPMRLPKIFPLLSPTSFSLRTLICRSATAVFLRIFFIFAPGRPQIWSPFYRGSRFFFVFPAPSPIGGVADWRADFPPTPNTHPLMGAKSLG